MSVYESIKKNVEVDVPSSFLKIDTIDMHTGGEPLRVVVGGMPELKGSTVLEYRRHLRDHHDHLRKGLMYEPRGHADMYGCYVTPPNKLESGEIADFGIVFMHNEGYSTMCGHAIIAISKLAVQMKWIDVTDGENVLKIDAPCGRIISFVDVEEGRVIGVRFHGVPSFVVGLDYKIEVAGLGAVTYDLAYGGAFYAYVDMAKNDFDFDLSKKSYQQLISVGMDIKRAVMKENQSIIHPFEEDLSFLYGTIFLETDLSKLESKNVCIFAEGEVDRCPTGSGVSGRMAIHRARKEVDYNQFLKVESIVGSTFMGSLVEDLVYGPHEAVVPQVEGTAYITGQHTFIVDPEDPLKEGFLFR